MAAELRLIFPPQKEARYFPALYFPGTAPHQGARDEDAEDLSFEALIQAVLNSNTEEIDAGESWRPALSANRYRARRPQTATAVYPVTTQLK